MTPDQLKKSTTKELVIAYKNKARCFHSRQKAESIFNELIKRLGSDKLNDIRLETWHLQNGEGDAMFNEACDTLIKQL